MWPTSLKIEVYVTLKFSPRVWYLISLLDNLQFALLYRSWVKILVELWPTQILRSFGTSLEIGSSEIHQFQYFSLKYNFNYYQNMNGKWPEIKQHRAIINDTIHFHIVQMQHYNSKNHRILMSTLKNIDIVLYSRISFN